jgi:hypothetical protein
MKSQIQQFAQGHTFNDDDKKIVIPKHCRSCDYVAKTVQEVKDNYYRNPTTKDRRNGDCKRCMAAKQKIYRQNTTRKKYKKTGEDTDAKYFRLLHNDHLKGWAMILDGVKYSAYAGDGAWQKGMIEHDECKSVPYQIGFSGMKIEA